MALDLLLLGAPGAGKGTQAKRISTAHGIPQIATGDMLRAAVSGGTELGRRVEPILSAGELVPDDLMVALIRERLSMGDTEAGFILDGFPRTIPQAEALDTMLDEIERTLAAVLEFQLDSQEAVRRILGRAEAEGRSDDTPEVAARRLDVYREQTEPLVAYYLAQGILVGIDAGRSVGNVSRQIEAVVEQIEARA